MAEWEQLTLPGVDLDRRAVVPIEPQPWQTQKGWWGGGSFWVGDWNWEHTPGVTTCTNRPETSQGWLKNSPFQPGAEYADGAVIESVRAALISTGWVWVVTLRDYNDDDLVPFWEALRPPVVGGCDEAEAE
jgi:hypothetical protein